MVQSRTAPERAPFRFKFPPFATWLQSETSKSARSGLAIAIGGIFAHRSKVLDERMLWRQVTYRICGPGVARKEESLASASAKIVVAPFARLAGFLHPVRAAESQKRR